MSIHYDENIRTIAQGKYADFQKNHPEICQFLGYDPDAIRKDVSSSSEGELDISDTKYSLELIKNANEYWALLILYIDCREEFGSGDNGSVYHWRVTDSSIHKLNPNIIDDDKTIIDYINDNHWSELQSGNIYYTKNS